MLDNFIKNKAIYITASVPYGFAGGMMQFFGKYLDSMTDGQTDGQTNRPTNRVT